MRIAFIGMGEAGSAIVSGWGPDRAGQIVAFDAKTDDPATAPAMRERYATLGIEGATDLSAALTGADLVLSVVTADQALAVARAAAPHLGQGATYCDLNSVAPSSKTAAADAVEAAGGRYVDVAVMAPVHPKRNMAPLLLSGPHAAATAEMLSALPMAPRTVEGPVGRASSIKMIRSVMVKGLEALTAECLLAASAAGVADEVIASLEVSHPGTDWRARGPYNLERMEAHGLRRAAEMEEVAKTLTDLGLPDDMAAATVRWQRRVGDLRLDPPDGDLEAFAGPLLAALRR